MSNRVAKMGELPLSQATTMGMSRMCYQSLVLLIRHGESVEDEEKKKKEGGEGEVDGKVEPLHRRRDGVCGV
jgi:hypothetical protein